MATYKLYPAAEKDLEGIWYYTVDEWSIKQANKYIDDLHDAFQSLADRPLRCHERTEYTPPVRIHRHDHHLIVYLQSDTGIFIVRVLHERMDIEAQLEA